MALTDNQKRMIQAVTQNDIQGAKKCAVACIVEDTTAKNKQFCERYKSILESTGSNMIELPSDLKNILCVEDVTNSFKANRYYLTSRERTLFENIMRMKRVSEKLLSMQIPYLNSTLLYGESGTGKTTFGRYVAHETGLPFCYLNFSNLVDSYMGNTSKNISKAFNYAVTNPCVLMLDEIDCISIRRSDASSGSGTGGEMARITITLMQEFDKLTNDLIVIGATNRKDRIDEALLRRFSVKHEITGFSETDRILMVHKFISDIDIDFTETEILEIANKFNNQSQLTSELIRRIAAKLIESEMEV